MSLYSFHHDAAGQLVIEPKKDWYSIKEAARILTISEMSVFRAIRSKKLSAQPIGGVHKVGKWRIPYEALRDALSR